MNYLLNSDERASGIFFWMDCMRPNEWRQRSNANAPSDTIAFFIDGANLYLERAVLSRDWLELKVA
ncbi:hypothetical protein [Bradyrhizobium sp. WSM2254]|uniref:hypothetical protein n=1 Tax=Bradyrhizobium sp. WSM2254 TaxID=1188263 RepID=UPI0018DC1E2D|nr:hypothetical protein [Bradyrhizobium sp. WSM2254]